MEGGKEGGREGGRENRAEGTEEGREGAGMKKEDMALMTIVLTTLPSLPPSLPASPTEEDALPEGGSGIPGGVRLLKGTDVFISTWSLHRYALPPSLPPSRPPHGVRLVEPVILTPMSPYFPHFCISPLTPPCLPPSLLPSLPPPHRSDTLWESPNDYKPDRWLRPMENPGVKVRREGGREGGKEGGRDVSLSLVYMSHPSLPSSLPPFLPSFLPGLGWV